MPDPLGDLGEAERQYVERVRGAAHRLGIRGPGPDASRDALADLEDLLPLDVDPPSSSPSSAGRLVKSAVKRLVRWYVAYLARQVTSIGEAVLRLGSHLSTRVDELETVSHAQGGRILELEQRVAVLESRSTGRL